MNQHAQISSEVRSKRLFTVSDLERMVEAGVIDPDERLELIDGEILKMSPKGIAHEVLKLHLTLHLADNRKRGAVIFATETGWRLRNDLYLEPDFLIFPASKPFADVTGPDAFLVIEIAVSSLAADLKLKGAIYAELGVREYWVIDAMLREIHVHLEPTSQGYASARTYPADVTVTPTFMPGYALRLADLPTT